MRALALAVALVVAAPAVRAQTPPAPGKKSPAALADQYYDAGLDALRKRRFTTAIAAFEAGFGIQPTVKLVLGLALAYKTLWRERSDPEHLRHAIARLRQAQSMPGAKRLGAAIRSDLDALEPAFKRLVAEGAISATLPPLEGSSRATARVIFERGKALYDRGQYAEAAAAFAEAYEAHPHPPFLFNIGASYEQSRQYAKAVEHYRRYLEAAPASDDAASVRRRIAALEAELQRNAAAPESPDGSGPGLVAAPIHALAPAKTQLMIASQTPGARASIDGGPPGEIGVALEVAPGRHVIRVSAPGFIDGEVAETAVEGRLVVATLGLEPKDAAITFAAPAGATVKVNGRQVPREVRVPAGSYRVEITKRGRVPIAEDVEVERGQALAFEVDMQRTKQRQVSTWVAGGAGVLALSGLVTTAVTIAAQRRASDIDDRRGTEPLSADDLEAFEDAVTRRDRFRTASIVLLGAAAAAAATAGALYWFDTPSPPGAPSIRLVPAGAGAALSGSF